MLKNNQKCIGEFWNKWPIQISEQCRWGELMLFYLTFIFAVVNIYVILSKTRILVSKIYMSNRKQDESRNILK